MPGKFTFRGREIEEISKLNLEEFTKMLTSRERRAIKRGFTPAEKDLLLSIRQSPGRYHKTHSREMVIIPEMVGKKIGVHNGKEFVALDIKPEMLGHRLGEFVITRKMVRHSAPGFGATKSSK